MLFNWNDDDFSFDQAPSFISPGAGLSQLDFFQDSDLIYDSLFTSSVQPDRQSSDSSRHSRPTSLPKRAGPIVRVYGSDEDLLNAYYVFIHPYFPVLPPPVSSPVVDRPSFRPKDEHREGHGNNASSDFEPSSPITLAISTILALVPYPDDVDAPNPESVLYRRKSAQSFAESTMESIEIESEIMDSDSSPSRALTSSSPTARRASFHPNVPVGIESILALLILSIYEYAQRGNISKMRTRAGQALISAMDMSLHSQGDNGGKFAEAKRRAWWMCYTCPPTISIHDPRFTTKYPSIGADADAWPFFLSAQQTILAATQFILDQNKAFETKSNMSYIYEKMQELNSILDPLLARADAWSTDSSTMPVDASEAVVGLALKSIARIKLNSARIKLHRYCAFTDKALFSEKHCDLKSSSQDVNLPDGEHSTTTLAPACGCGNLFDNSSVSSISLSPSSPVSPRSSSMSSIGSIASISDVPELNLPFSSHLSAKYCLKAALNIAQSFETLPYPNPTGDQGSLAPSSSSDSGKAPRTMPSFACCAMQSSYAMLMICHKTRATNGEGFIDQRNEHLVSNLTSQLRNGLQKVVGALDNYSMSFEALSGMRDQVRAATDVALSSVS
ncbi:MAG: hypothetical protein ALECFALPRED_000394 [Alectoria fallacina]|uniref:Xylanolytic transcriptional activator regulatory domain-containing protein n=1 Tax=Alectoria fallacina TaxID=1903189 RepID=A0A8H3J9P6_9LECA|nr:MAG: hypothetical protein ALECFALPRED_000394 [Alectoria fallacina]